MKALFRKLRSKRKRQIEDLTHRRDAAEAENIELKRQLGEANVRIGRLEERLSAQKSFAKLLEILSVQGESLSRVADLIGKQEERFGRAERKISELDRIANSRLDDGK